LGYASVFYSINEGLITKMKEFTRQMEPLKVFKYNELYGLSELLMTKVQINRNANNSNYHLDPILSFAKSR